MKTEKVAEYLVASESVALDTLGFELVRDVEPGEAIFIDQDGNFYSRQCAANPQHNPCIFEFVYLARPDSVIDGISVYETRMRMGRSLADKIRRDHRDIEIDVVIPIPDSSRPSAMELARKARTALSRGFHQEPLHRAHLHHAGPRGAQAIGKAETQCDRHGIQGPERPAGGRLDRARDDQP